MSGGQLIAVTVVGLIVIVVLGVILGRKLREDKIESLLRKRRNVAKVSQAALYIEGPSQVPVAVTLTKSMLFYENEDLQASLELARIDEVEYDDDVSTAHSAAHGRVLRLRSHGQVFEFILKKELAKEFEEHLPPHHVDQPGEVRVV
jgi:hypothetical protein